MTAVFGRFITEVNGFVAFRAETAACVFVEVNGVAAVLKQSKAL